MISRILHQTSSHDLNFAEKRIRNTALKRFPGWNYRLWSNQDNLELVSSTIPQHLDAFRNISRGVITADICRCLYMYKYGGIYFDTDYKFYRALEPELLEKRCVLGVEEMEVDLLGGADKVGNALLASEPGFPLWLPFIDYIFENLAKHGEDDVVFSSGPHALTLFLQEHADLRNEIHFLTVDRSYPAFSFLKMSTFHARDTLGGHLCWGGWRSKSNIQRARNRARILLSCLLAGLI